MGSECDRPCFICIGGETSGFVVFMNETGQAECHTYIGEIFVLSEYRKRGIAGRVACDYISSLEYDTGGGYVRGSKAEKFWIRLLDDKKYRYDVSREDEVRDFVHIHLWHE